MMEKEQVLKSEVELAHDEVDKSNAAVDGLGICNPWDQDTPGMEVHGEPNEEAPPYSVDMMLSLLLVAS
jgi:hypothetical protein